ncbi:MAG: phosphoenolpyruvate synthase [Halobacteriovorax sp.]|nr:phosphoenolpyruvate synthase [Halobacteriovorax sp.]|tara:strand:- start:61028 stop:63709 length:2682 start_codon:yes stop_codon:yes gene_type:complete
MLYIDENSTQNYAARMAGGKGFNLYLMTKAGLKVPSWIVLGPDCFEEFKSLSNINEKFTELESTISDPKELCEKIEALILETEYPLKVKEFIKKTFDKLGKELISVRSSALDEDGSSHSFAGQLSSYLYISSFDAVLESVKKCWASAYSERGLVYRRENKLSSENIQVAVVLQEMICPEKAGVLFTCDPINEDPDHLLINSVYGVGEGLVSGLYDADNFKIEKESGKIIEQEITDKPKMLIQDTQKQEPKEVEVAEDKINISSLNDEEIASLHKMAKDIEKLYRFPQDVEWAIQDNTVYLLQSRPVTTNVRAGTGNLFVWDNSNIVESYGGITMPLTFGFAHYVYHQVYVQFCEILLVPAKQIRQMDHFLKDMLGLFYGRVYYNLLNWYKLTSILPGYKYNRGFMETMMGTDEALQDEIAERVKPPSFHHTFGATVRRIIVGFKFLYFHYRIQTVVDDFLSYFYKKYNKFRKINFDHMPADEIYDYYKQMEKEMLWKWHAPIINDFLTMVHYGIFKKLTEKWLSHLGDAFHNDLLAGNGNLESAEPTKRLIIMAGKIDKIEGLKNLILNTPNADCLESLNQSEYKDFYEEVKEYIDLFGFRCMSEMKLEQKDLHQDPSLLFVFLKNLINAGQTDLEVFEKREKEIRENAENLLRQNIGGIRGLIYSWSLKHARKAVMNRENTRFCRTRVYGIVRSMFYGIGKDYTAKKIIDVKEDIFYLNLQELKGSLEGTLTTQDLKGIINERRRQYDAYAEGEEPAPRFFTRGPCYWQNQHFPIEEVVLDDSPLEENQMRGIPCCPGEIEGEVKLILDPGDDMVLNGEILVTKRTDPGWIPLYPSAKALLVERGGLLSHSAIVAREMGLPTIVSIKGLTSKLETGMRIKMNGETGLIEILE